MSKTLITIPEGNLMRLAATKSITTLTALKEKTGVDRKTLRAIDAGKAVKETTLQSIADKLRVPLEHLRSSNVAEKREEISGSSIDEWKYREIKLQRLDASALRKLAGETDEICWFLNIDQMSAALEQTLLKLGENLRGWFHHILGVEFGPEDLNNLKEQISYIKTSTDIDKTVEELAQHKLNILGGTYVAWQKERPRHPIEDYPLPILKYTSRLLVALSVTPESSNNSTVRVSTGWEPPQKFMEAELTDFEAVEIDGTRVWSRPFDPDIAEKSKIYLDLYGDIPR